MNPFKFISDQISRLTAPRGTFYEGPVDNKVIFAGPDSIAADPNDYNFGIYVPTGVSIGFFGKRNDPGACWLPAVTSEPAIVEQLKAMKIGQVFKITSERNDGPMGTRVDAIATDNDARVYSIPADACGFIRLPAAKL